MSGTFEKTSIAEGITGQILELIREGRYVPGVRLPGERALAKQLKVSRTSLREALHQLEAVGLLERRQGLGTFVKAPSAATSQLPLVPRLLTDQATLQKIYEIRQIIEVAAAGRAAARATSAQIASMHEWLEALERYVDQDDPDGITIADVEFHRQIIIAAGNEILVGLMDSIIDLLYEMRQESSSIPELLAHVRSDHQAILRAIEQRDSPAAREAMQFHLDFVSAQVSKYWAGNND